jgi:hypothetical protein
MNDERREPEMFATSSRVAVVLPWYRKRSSWAAILAALVLVPLVLLGAFTAGVMWLGDRMPGSRAAQQYVAEREESQVLLDLRNERDAERTAKSVAEAELTVTKGQLAAAEERAKELENKLAQTPARAATVRVARRQTDGGFINRPSNSPPYFIRER